MLAPLMMNDSMVAGSPGYANSSRNSSASAVALPVLDDVFAGLPEVAPTSASRQVNHIRRLPGPLPWCKASDGSYAEASSSIAPRLHVI